MLHHDRATMCSRILFDAQVEGGADRAGQTDVSSAQASAKSELREGGRIDAHVRRGTWC
jgi:hypothetical protein